MEKGGSVRVRQFQWAGSEAQQMDASPVPGEKDNGSKPAMDDSPVPGEKKSGPELANEGANEVAAAEVSNLLFH